MPSALFPVLNREKGNQASVIMIKRIGINCEQVKRQPKLNLIWICSDHYLKGDKTYKKLYYSFANYPFLSNYQLNCSEHIVSNKTLCKNVTRSLSTHLLYTYLPPPPFLLCSFLTRTYLLTNHFSELPLMFSSIFPLLTCCCLTI